MKLSVLSSWMGVNDVPLRALLTDKPGIVSDRGDATLQISARRDRVGQVPAQSHKSRRKFLGIKSIDTYDGSYTGLTKIRIG